MATQKTRIITVTGTKGKTSVVRALHYAIQATYSEPVLGVDTHKIVLGDTVISSFLKSQEISGLVPTVCPGRFLYSLANSKSPVAVLESSVGSSQSPGLGYRSHEIGIFTNVYDDHIGAKPYLSNREDLARAKSFVFTSIRTGGFAVYNADNDLVVAQLERIPDSKNVKRIACTLDSERSLDADCIATVINGSIVLRADGREVVRVPIDAQPWLFGGNHEPSLYNALFCFSSLWAFFRDDSVRFSRAIESLQSYVPDEQGGRMVVRKSQKGAAVVIDFAHEAVSLTQIGQFAKKELAPTGKTIGVIRLSGERSDQHIAQTTERFAPYFDELVIYEQPATKLRKAGDVASVMSAAAAKVGVPVRVILNERVALVNANETAGAGDAVVYIIGSSRGSYQLADDVFQLKEV